jgi:intracellular multiplication protein IcmO
LIEGEAIVLFGGRRIYARLFHALIDDTGPKRLGHTLMLRPPDPDAVRRRLARIGDIAAAIESGTVALGPQEEISPGLRALARGFRGAARQGGNARDCARGALAEIARVPEDLLSHRPPPPADGAPVTSVTPMLAAASTAMLAGADTAGLPHEPVDGRLAGRLAAIEHAAGASEAASCRTALAILAERGKALAAPIAVEPPAMALETFQAHLAAVMRQLETLPDTAHLRSAA